MCAPGLRSFHRRPHRMLAVIGALLACAWIAASAVASERPPYSFSEVVSWHFDQWDRNHDGRLSAVEVDRLVQSHSVVGPEAAAVAAIHRYLRGKKTHHYVSEMQLLRHHPKNGHRNRHDSRPRFSSDYATFYWRLQRAPRRLFGDADGPCLSDMKQGKLGDCYFISSLGVAVLRNPDAVRRMLRPRRDGSTDVFFTGRPPVNIPPLTDSEIALSSTTGDQGLWLNVLEKAFSRVTFGQSKKQQRWDIDLDAISRGGSAGSAISIITGHAAKTVYIRSHKGKGRAPTSRRLSALRRRFHNLLSRSIGAGALTCAATPTRGRLPKKIANHHVFAILGYDRQRRIVHMWNPWANDFEPQGRPGLRNGYPTRNGRFHIPLDDFLRVFRCAFVESGQRARS